VEIRSATHLIGFTRVLANEGVEFGIKVNAIAPIANTRMLDRSMQSVAELAGAQDREHAALKLT
jgi:NAD(P)-dependent dehydrogenase (short-subunit alcohol dehydrogenase family)